MNRSLVSIIVVVVSLLTAFSGTWLFLRLKAENQPTKPPFKHSFATAAHESGRRLVLLKVEKPQDVANIKAKTKSEGLSVSIGFWLDVRLAGDNQLVVSRDEVLVRGPAKGKPIELASRVECREAGLFELADFNLNGRLVVLNLISRRPGLSQKILEIWGRAEKPLSLDTTALQSESEGTLKELRDAEPRGFFGSSQSTLLQLEILSTLGLDGLTSLKSDLLISDIEERRDGELVPRVRPSTLSAAHHRGLRRYVGPIKTLKTARTLLDQGYDGLIVEDRGVFDELLRTSLIPDAIRE